MGSVEIYIERAAINAVFMHDCNDEDDLPISLEAITSIFDLALKNSCFSKPFLCCCVLRAFILK